MGESLLERLLKESRGKKIVSYSKEEKDNGYEDLIDTLCYVNYFDSKKMHHYEGVRSSKHIVNVIFENNHTIIVDNFGNRYISRPEKGEKFDEEKGLLVALAKYDGHSTTEILELLKGAVRKNGTKTKAKKNKV